MQPFTVLLEHGGDGPPHVHHVTAQGPVAAYKLAVDRQEAGDALAYDIGLGRRLPLKKAVVEWPPIGVYEGHLALTPILWTGNLFERAAEEIVNEPALETP